MKLHDRVYLSWQRVCRLVCACAAGLVLMSCAGPAPVLAPPPESDPSIVASAQEQQEIARFVSTYRLASGDVLSIRVFGEPDLSQPGVRLTDSGTIFLPTIGELSVSGLRLGEVERLVVERLRGRILVNPIVSVSIEQYRPFFINGMVRSPGAYPFQPGLTLRKAVSLAGGLLERASLRKMFVIRAGDPSQSLEPVEFASTVMPGDVITIEESFF